MKGKGEKAKSWKRIAWGSAFLATLLGGSLVKTRVVDPYLLKKAYAYYEQISEEQKRFERHRSIPILQGRDARQAYLQLAYRHSSDEYRRWLEWQSKALGTSPWELHTAAMETARNIQLFFREQMESPQGRQLPLLVFSDKEKLLEHAILLGFLASRSTRVEDALRPLNEEFERLRMHEKMALRPGRYAPWFYGSPITPAHGHTFMGVNTVHDEPVINGFSRVLVHGFVPPNVVGNIGHEAAHGFGELDESRVEALEEQLDLRVRSQPVLFKKIFAPLLRLQEAWRSRQAQRTRHENQKPSFDQIPRRALEFRRRKT